MAYDWEKDSRDSWALAIRMMALAIGSVHFHTIPEMYWQEAKGVIP